MQRISILASVGVVEWTGDKLPDIRRMYRPKSIMQWIGARIIGATVIIEEGTELEVRSEGFFHVNSFALYDRKGGTVYFGSPVGGKLGFLEEGRVSLSGVSIDIENMVGAAGFDTDKEAIEEIYDEWLA